MLEEPLTEDQKRTIEAMYFAGISVYTLDEVSHEAIAYYHSLSTKCDF